VELAEKVVRESMNFTEKEALEEKLIDLVATDLEDLLERLEGRTVRRFDDTELVLRVAGEPLIHLEMTTRERLLSAIANPSLSFILLGLGLIGLYVEFSHPGLILPGVAGVICLLLFGFSTQILPINWVGLLLILAALALFALEVKVTSYGALTAGGVLCLILGGIMLYDTPEIPEMRVPLGLLVAVSIAVGGITALLLGLAVRAHRHKVETGEEGLVGLVGTAVTDLDPTGKVFVRGEYWEARAEENLPSGVEIRVVKVDGLYLQVRRSS
jgi:membrane-bound serine protease (ClpP class)